MAEILVVDDEMGIRELLSEILGDEGHSVTLAENAQRAREAMQASKVELVLLDIWMPDTDGVTLLKEWAAAGQLTMPVIMMSGHATIETAVEATRIGALDFLEKPIALQKLLKAVEQGLSKGKNGAVPVRVMPSYQPLQASSALSMLQVPGPQTSSHLMPLSSPTAQFLASPAGGYSMTNVRFTNNRFSNVHYACVGAYGVWYTRGAPSDRWNRTGNILLETGQSLDNTNPTVNGWTCR